MCFLKMFHFPMKYNYYTRINSVFVIIDTDCWLKQQKIEKQDDKMKMKEM